MARTKKVEIWAQFENGMERYIETSRNPEAAEAAIGAMVNSNKNDLAEGYGFPFGVPIYSTKPYGTCKLVGQIIY